MSQRDSKVYIQVKTPEDWNKLLDLKFEFCSGSYSTSGREMFEHEINNNKTVYIQTEGALDSNDLNSLVSEISGVLGDSVAIFAVSSNYNVGDNSYLIYYFGDKIVHYDYYEGESEYEYDDDGELIEPDEEIDGDAMSALFYEIDINNISKCIKYCSESGVKFTEKEISTLKAFKIKV